MSNFLSADTDQMRATVQTLDQASRSLEANFRQARQAMDAMQSSNWSGRRRVAFEHRWDALNAQFNPLVANLAAMARELQRVAEAYDEAARVFGDKGVAPETSDSSPPPPDNGSNQLPHGVPAPIPADGPTTKPGVLPGLGGCTHYIATRRNLDDWKRWPNAHEWNDAAQESGYEVSNTPTQGAILVFEKGTIFQVENNQGQMRNTWADKNYGHVAYVEQVDWSAYPDKVRVQISDGNYNGLMGSSGPVSTKWIEIPPDQAANISFVHGKKKA